MVVSVTYLALAPLTVHSQGQKEYAQLLPPAPATQPAPLVLPAPEDSDSPLPINLPTALQLANARPLDVALASWRINIAAAQLERAQTLRLATL